jgi:hypothetical protein
MTFDRDNQKQTILQALGHFYRAVTQQGPDNHSSACQVQQVLQDVQAAAVEEGDPEEGSADRR